MRKVQVGEQLDRKAFKLVGDYRITHAHGIELVQQVERAVERAAVDRDIGFIIAEHLAIERTEIVARYAARCLQPLLQHQLCTAANMLLHRFGGEQRSPHAVQHMVDRRSQVAAGVDERTVEIESDNVERNTQT